MLISLPAAAQTRQIDSQIDSLQQQIQQLQQQLQGLQSQVNDSAAAARQAQDEAQAARAQAQQAAASPAAGPHVTQSSGNRFGIESADGRYSIALTGRLHFDIGDYLDYRPASSATSPQDLHSGVNARRARLGVVGKFAGDWDYAFIADFGGSSDNGGPSYIENAYITYNGFHPAAIDLGYMDTPYTLDEATSSNDIMFMERASSQAIATGLAAGDNRSAVGVRTHGDRYWLGLYATGPTSGASHTVGEPLGAFGRATYQVLQAPDYSLHLGIDAEGLFKAPGSPQTLSLSDRPELRIDPTVLLTTGTLGTTANPISGAAVYSVEAAGGYHSLFAQGEYFRYQISRTGLSTADFGGGYIEASWTLTGEHRHYIPGSGAYSAITPAHPFSLSGAGFGAFEIAARYSEIDLNDNFVSGDIAGPGTDAVAGGRQTVYTVGLNWYPVKNIRFMLDYLHGEVSKESAVTGSGAPVLGTPIGASFDAIALRTQVAF